MSQFSFKIKIDRNTLCKKVFWPLSRWNLYFKFSSSFWITNTYMYSGKIVLFLKIVCIVHTRKLNYYKPSFNHLLNYLDKMDLESAVHIDQGNIQTPCYMWRYLYNVHIHFGKG